MCVVLTPYVGAIDFDSTGKPIYGEKSASSVMHYGKLSENGYEEGSDGDYDFIWYEDTSGTSNDGVSISGATQKQPDITNQIFKDLEKNDPIISIVNSGDYAPSKISGVFAGNKVEKNPESGLIRISGSNVGEIDGMFANNTTVPAGAGVNYGVSVIFNEDGSTIDKITGSFLANETTGGVIRNKAKITSESSTRNHSDGSVTSISRDVVDKDRTSTIGTISADFHGNKATFSYDGRGGGAIANTSSDIEAITGSTFTNNSTAKDGGAILNASQPLSVHELRTKDGETTKDLWTTEFSDVSSTIEKIENSRFKGNTAAQYGGAIFNGPNSTIGEITGCSFENNYAGLDGGAISNGDGKNVAEIGSIEVVTFSGNTADFASRGGGAILNRGFATITSISIDLLTNNSVGQNDNRNTSGGGGIANYGTIGDIYIGEASGNRAWRNNGGVILNWTTNTANESADIGIISGESFHDNFAYGSGGAIHNEGEGATIEAILVKEFRNNISTSSGGAVRNYKSAEILNHTLNSNFIDNYASNRGGALFFEGTLSTDSGNGGIIGTENKHIEYTGNASGNDGGAIVLAESWLIDETDQKVSTSTIQKISYVDFTNNRSGVSLVRPDIDYTENGPVPKPGVTWKNRDDWKENAEGAPVIANGGAILNGFRYVDVNIDPKTGEQLALEEWLQRAADGKSYDGVEYYIFKSYGSTIGTIEHTTFKGNTAGYKMDGDLIAVDENHLASGGAIANGYIDHYINVIGDGEDKKEYNFWLIAQGHIENINHTEFTENKAIYRGGAIYNARGDIGTISDTTFSKNEAYRTDGSGDGGAIFNNKSTSIDSIVSSTFDENKAGGNGGAIFNEMADAIAPGSEGYIGDISGSTFRKNEAKLHGGAIYNSGNIGTFDDDVDGTSVIGGIVNTSFLDNKATGGESHGGGIWTNGKLAIVADGGTVQFTGNTAAKANYAGNQDSDSSGLYISGAGTEVYLISKENSHILFNDIIEGTLEGENMDKGEMSALRLRGYTETADKDSGKGGAVTFNHFVKHTDIEMDDVTLYLGVLKNDEKESEADDKKLHTSDNTRVKNTTKDDTYHAHYVSYILAESNLKANTGVVNTVDGEGTNYIINKLVTTSESKHPDTSDRYATFAIDIIADQVRTGKQFEVTNDNGHTTMAEAQLSDVFTINSQDSTGFISLSQLAVDTYKARKGTDDEKGREDEKDGSYGYDDPSLSTSESNNRRETDENGKGVYSNYDDYYVQIINYRGSDYKETDKTATDFKIQLDIKDLKVADYEQSHMTSSDVLAKELELVSVRTYHDSLHVVGWRDPLAAWAEYGEDALTTGEPDPENNDPETPHKSFTIEQGHTQTLTRNINLPSNDDKRTDNVNDKTSPLMTGKDLRIIGRGNTVSILDVNRKNMLTLVGEEQSVRLQNLLLQNVQTATRKTDYDEGDERRDITTNKGNLILDTMVAYENYQVQNNLVNWLVDNQTDKTDYNTEDGDRRLTVTGNTDINYIITTTGDKIGEMTIDNSTRVLNNVNTERNRVESTVYIWNAVSNQNITHNEVAHAQPAREGDEETSPKPGWTESKLEEPVKGNLNLIYDFSYDGYSTVTHLYTTKDSNEATKAFLMFQNNSLDMQNGAFVLHDMEYYRLILRDFNINHGAVVVNSTKIDLQNRRMGGIDTKVSDSVSEGATGAIWLGKFELHNDTPRWVTHVKFVDTHVGRVVRDGFGLAQNPGKMVPVEGRKYRYYASYANFRFKDITAAVDKLGKDDPYNHIMVSGNYGYYTFVRSGMSSRLNSGAVTQATVFPMIQTVFNYSFHHADLYADCMAPPAPTAPGGFEVVTPMKGKDYAGNSAVTTATAALAGDRAADYAAAERSVAYRGGMWLRPYISFENIPLHDGPKVDATLYGALVGFDTPVTDYTNGWSSVFTGYLGYNGSRLRWDGYRTTTNGGLIGVTETFYKNHFFAALTANIGITAGDTHSSYGSEDYTMYTLGVAGRVGYNFELDQGKYVIQPAVQLSYTLGMVDAYTNAEGVRMKASPMHAIQISPMVKVIKHTESEWKPYLTGAVVWTLAGETKFKAEGDKLPGMSLRPYVEYGIGIQKTWADRYTFYGQVTGHSLGRQGIEISGGIRWAW